MALRVPKLPQGQLFKEGYKHLQGVDEAVLRNIHAITELSNMVKTSFGPNGRKKLIVNHLEKLFVTSDAATIVKELDVIHPAAKLLVMASQAQEAEMGDGTNFVTIFAGELLRKAEELLRMGLHQADIVAGYEVAYKKALSLLEGLEVEKVDNLRDEATLLRVVLPAVMAKQHGYEDVLAPLIAEAAMMVMPTHTRDFNVDSIRVVKIMGASVFDSKVVKGMVFGREPEGEVKRTPPGGAKVAVFTCPLDITQTETKGTVLLKNANDLLSFSKDEEKRLEAQLKEIADTGVKVVVTGSSLGELCLHFLNRFGIMVLKVPSKFDLRRLCRVTGATALARIGAPHPEEIGFCDVVETVELGSDRCTVFRQEQEKTRTATIVLRGSTQNLLDDHERAVDDGVNVIKALTKDARLVPGAGSTDIALSCQLQAVAQSTPGITQYALGKFAEALEVVPRTLAENAGLDATEVVSNLYAAHQAGHAHAGVNIDAAGEDIPVTRGALATAGAASSSLLSATTAGTSTASSGSSGASSIDGTSSSSSSTTTPTALGVLDVVQHGILDLMGVRAWGIRLAANAALTILRVDQIIMSRPAGGPKPPPSNKHWDED